jgi:hypothetical protein
MIQTYNYFNQQELPSLLLCNPNKAQRFSLGHAYNIKNTLKYNALSELQFDYPMVTGSETIYDEIQGRMLVLVEGVGYYIIQSAPENGQRTYKKCKLPIFGSGNAFKKINWVYWHICLPASIGTCVGVNPYLDNWYNRNVIVAFVSHILIEQQHGL